MPRTYDEWKGDHPDEEPIGEVIANIEARVDDLCTINIRVWPGGIYETKISFSSDRLSVIGANGREIFDRIQAVIDSATNLAAIEANPWLTGNCRYDATC